MTMKTAASKVGNGLLTATKAVHNSAIQGQIDEIDTEMDELQNRINELKDRRSDLEERKF
jgi:prefoldin subunit 5